MTYCCPEGIRESDSRRMQRKRGRLKATARETWLHEVSLGIPNTSVQSRKVTEILLSACLVIISHHCAETQLLEYLIMLNMKGEKEGGDTKDHLGKGVLCLKRWET